MLRLIFFALLLGQAPLPEPSVPSAVDSGRRKPAPLLADDAGVVSHPRWDGSKIADPFNAGWTMQGAVPQVSTTSAKRPGAGPFTSDANYRILGSPAGTDALDFAGDWRGCIVYVYAAQASGTLASDGAYTVSGWYAAIGSDGSAVNFCSSGGSNVSVTFTTPANGTLNVLCFGRAGGTAYVKSNSATTVSRALATYVNGTNKIATLGTQTAGSAWFTGTIVEAVFSSLPWDEGWAVAQNARVH